MAHDILHPQKVCSLPHRQEYFTEPPFPDAQPAWLQAQLFEHSLQLFAFHAASPTHVNLELHLGRRAARQHGNSNSAQIRGSAPKLYNLSRKM